MKRKQLFATAKRVFAVFATTLLFAGCEGLFPEGEGPEGEQITITATTENTVSRTTLNAADEVVWQKDEFITLYDMATGIETQSFQISGGIGTTSATFTGQKPAWTGSTWAYYGEPAYGVYNANVGAVQAYVDGSFAINANPMAAVCENLEDGIRFKNLAGIVELHISGTQNLASIEVSANEYLSGYYDLDQTTLEKSSSQYAVSNGGNVTLTDINVQLDEQNSKSFKVVVMPGTYTDFTVKMTNVDGSVVTKTAEEDIIVERSKITPVTGLVDSAEPVEIPKYVTLSFVEENTNWHQTIVRAEMSSEVQAFLYMWGTDAFIEEWMSANQGKTIVDMMSTNGSIYIENQDFLYAVETGVHYNFYAVGLVQQEGDGYAIAGDVHHIDYTPKIPYHENATISITIPEATLTENSAVAQITPSTSFSKVYVSLYGAAVDTNYSENVIFYNVVVVDPKAHENISAAFDVNFDSLSPATNYVVYAVGETSDGKYTHLAKQFFTTPEHVASAVTATASIIEVKDWTAKFNISLNGDDATGYKYAIFLKSTVDNNPTVNWADEVALYETFRTDAVLECSGLTESTEYVLATIAYDSNNSYGAVSMLNFTTTALVPDPNAVGYSDWLGQLQFYHYVNSGGQSVDGSSGHTITITEKVAGKLYNITGLFGYGGNIGDTGDDTVVARFNGEGNPIQVDWESGVADAGSWAESYNVHCSLILGNSVYLQGPQIWANGDGTYGIGHTSDIENSGYTFGAWNKSNGEFAGTLPGAIFYDGKMRRVEAAGSSASTEKFNRAEVVSPTWKSVNPLQLNKNGFKVVGTKLPHTR